MPGYRGFLYLLFGTSLALIQRSPQEQSKNTKKKFATRGSHIPAIGHVPHAQIEILKGCDDMAVAGFGNTHVSASG